MSTSVTSTALLQGLRQEGNSKAWHDFCARYEPALLAFAQRAGLQEQDARDVVQETLVVFLERFRAGDYDRDRGRLRAWVQGIAFNKIREARRRLARPEVQVADETSTTPFMDRVPDEAELTDIFETEWQRGLLAECLRTVREQVDTQTFEAFELYALKDWPAERVAQHLGVARDSVYVSKCRVLSRLRELQEELGADW